MTQHPSRLEWIRAALEQYEAPLMRYATYLVGDAERARDVVQETFLHLCRADRSKVEDHLAAWLFRVCRNRTLDMRRKEKRVQALEPMTENNLESPEPGPEAKVARRQDAGRVAEILKTLPEKQREAIYLRFQGGLSYKEISGVTGHSVSNVGFLIHTAVKKIRERMLADNQLDGALVGGAR